MFACEYLLRLLWKEHCIVRLFWLEKGEFVLSMTFYFFPQRLWSLFPLKTP